MISTLSSGDAAFALAHSGAIAAEIASIGVGSALPMANAQASPATTASVTGGGGRRNGRDSVVAIEVIGFFSLFGCRSIPSPANAPYDAAASTFCFRAGGVQR